MVRVLKPDGEIVIGGDVKLAIKDEKLIGGYPERISNGEDIWTASKNQGKMFLEFLNREDLFCYITATTNTSSKWKDWFDLDVATLVVRKKPFTQKDLLENPYVDIDRIYMIDKEIESFDWFSYYAITLVYTASQS